MASENPKETSRRPTLGESAERSTGEAPSVAPVTTFRRGPAYNLRPQQLMSFQPSPQVPMIPGGSQMQQPYGLGTPQPFPASGNQYWNQPGNQPGTQPGFQYGIPQYSQPSLTPSPLSVPYSQPQLSSFMPEATRQLPVNPGEPRTQLSANTVQTRPVLPGNDFPKDPALQDAQPLAGFPPLELPISDQALGEMTDEEFMRLFNSPEEFDLQQLGLQAEGSPRPTISQEPVPSTQTKASPQAEARPSVVRQPSAAPLGNEPRRTPNPFLIPSTPALPEKREDNVPPVSQIVVNNPPQPLGQSTGPLPQQSWPTNGTHEIVSQVPLIPLARPQQQRSPADFSTQPPQMPFAQASQAPGGYSQMQYGLQATNGPQLLDGSQPPNGAGIAGYSQVQDGTQAPYILQPQPPYGQLPHGENTTTPGPTSLPTRAAQRRQGLQPPLPHRRQASAQIPPQNGGQVPPGRGPLDRGFDQEQRTRLMNHSAEFRTMLKGYVDAHRQTGLMGPPSVAFVDHMRGVLGNPPVQDKQRLWEYVNDKHVYFEPFIAFICENEDTTDDEYNLLYQLFELLQRNNCLDTSFLFLALMFAYAACFQRSGLTQMNRMMEFMIRVTAKGVVLPRMPHLPFTIEEIHRLQNQYVEDQMRAARASE
ncbi:hypothetical protein GGS26DRAFT_589481 [Hypomontagnella submonticulosa]|nr:hypothetical protein GGS26DRAFT_589481 [Hypomontagnella submonticulosa]